MTEKKKVLHVIQSLDRGGCENFLLRCLPLMDKIDNRVLALKNKGELADRFIKSGIRVDSLDGKWINLVSYVKNLNPDLVVTYLFHADFFGRIYLGLFTKYKPIPYLRTTYNFFKYRWVRLFGKLTSFMVPRYLANSNSVKDYYVKQMGVETNKITVIPNGINQKDYVISKSDRRKFRNVSGVKSTDLVITCVANFSPNKGHESLLNVFAGVCKKRKDVWLWLVGDGENKEKMVEIGRHLAIDKRTVFWGRRGDVPIILGSSDIFVLPTLFEGMSNAVLEAMASGLPVVVSDIPENREVVGGSGVLVSLGNDDIFIKNLLELIDNSKLRLKFGVRAKRRVEKLFGINLVVVKLSQFFTNLIILK